MGTNYYLHRPLTNICPHCGRGDSEDFNPPVHLGKSSAGWCFSLHVYPEGAEGVGAFSGLDGMKSWLSAEIAKGSSIRDEYHELLSLEDFLGVVTKREWYRDGLSDWWAPKHFGTTLDGKPFIFPGYTSEADFHRVNHSARGPNGLLRHQIDGVHCIAHGSGTWDCIVGDFS